MERNVLSPSLKAAAKLSLNHMDAWGTALIVSGLALVNHDAFSPSTLLLLLALTTGYWLAFVLNDYFDAPFDAADQGKARRNFFVQHALGKRPALLVALFVTTLIGAAFLQFGTRGLLVLALSLFVMWGYSAPPLRFKSRPGVDLLIHAIFVETYPYLVVLILIGADWKPLDYVLLAVLFFSSTAAQLEQQLRDFEVDRETGRTFATTIGRRPTRWLLRLVTAFLALLFAVNVFNGTIPGYIAVFGLIALPIVLARLLRRRGSSRPEKLVVALATTALLYMGALLLYVYFS